MSDKRYWNGFTFVKGIGAVRFQRLLDQFGNAESAWKTDSAFPLLSADDIMQSLNLTRVGQHKAARKALPADDVEAKLLTAMSEESLHVDEIRNKTGLPVEKVSATLVMMELKGMVRKVGNKQYLAVREVQSGYLVNDE